MAQYKKDQVVKVIDPSNELFGKEGVFVETVFTDSYFDVVMIDGDEIWFRFEAIEAVEYTYDVESFSDLYKDTNGFRPRGHRFYHPDTTPAEKQEIWDNMLIAHQIEMDRYEAQQKQNEVDFENAIATIIDSGAGDRETAIRWMLEAECDEYDLMYGFSYISYNFGISYDYQKEIQPIIDMMLEQMREAA